MTENYYAILFEQLNIEVSCEQFLIVIHKLYKVILIAFITIHSYYLILDFKYNQSLTMPQSSS